MKYFLFYSLFFACTLFVKGSNSNIGNNNPQDTIRVGNYFYHNNTVYDSSKGNVIIETNVEECKVVPIHGFLLVRKNDLIAFGDKEWCRIKIDGVKSFKFDIYGDIVYCVVSAKNDSFLIDLFNKRLTSIPIDADFFYSIEEIKDPTKVYKLDISEKKLTEISSKISRLSKLATLKMNKNEISNLPIDFFQLKNLEDLVLSQNKLTVIPNEIGKLTKLSLLNLSYNSLSDLPIEVMQLKNLKRLELKGNNFSKATKEKIRGWFKDTKCILDFGDDETYIDDY